MVVGGITGGVVAGITGGVVVESGMGTKWWRDGEEMGLAGAGGGFKGEEPAVVLVMVAGFGLEGVATGGGVVALLAAGILVALVAVWSVL